MWSVQSIAQGAVPDVHHMRCPSEVSFVFYSVEEICISCNFRLESMFPFCQQARVNVPSDPYNLQKMKFPIFIVYFKVRV